MKKIILSMAVLTAMAFTACEDDDNGVQNTFVVEQNNLKGSIPAGDDIILEAKTYKLTGALIVEEGAKLTIPAGAVIEATDISVSDVSGVRYIAVESGAKIYVNGTAASPVIMTCETKQASAWGGLVICGNAPTNKAGGEAQAEVSDLNYGGNVANDNSGSITHLRVEYTGFKYSDTKEFNGISLFGVGSGTKFENVTSFKGGDDGIEFFGGTVNGKYLLSIDSEDDGIDFADGWSGTGEYWFVRNASKSSIEGSNNGDNGAATPMTDATLKNITLIGSGEKPYYFKEGGGKHNIDNVVIGGLAASKKQAYFYADAEANDASVYLRLNAGDLVVTNAKFVSMSADQPKVWNEGLEITENESATGAGNGTNKPSWVSDAMNTISASVSIFE
jgi:hypothetical protein